LTLREPSGERWALESGELSLEVRTGTSPVKVETAEVWLRVAGAVFQVERIETSSRIWVQRGQVVVTSRLDGAVARLGPGEEMTIRRPKTPADAALSDVAPSDVAPSDAAPADVAAPESPRETRPLRRETRAEEIRSRLRRGHVAEARALLLEARRAASRRNQAELAMVQAEVELAEGQFAAAIQTYLSVYRDFPRAPQAESALFAAAQLAVDHPSRGVQGVALLRRYLETYPQGRFAAESRLLLDALEKEPK
jgi:ferric-dicitrate binding protein FerR (iron transport regulator)